VSDAMRRRLPHVPQVRRAHRLAHRTDREDWILRVPLLTDSPPREPDAAIASLYAQERHRLVRVSYLLTCDLGRAEEIVQEAFVSLYQRWDSLEDKSGAGGYLRVTVLNGSRAALRRRATANRYLQLLRPEPADLPGHGLLLAEEHEMVAAAVRELPRQQQRAVILRYWFELSDQQIADTLRTSVNGIRSNVSRALHTLAQRLESQ
jgi:RNA polymerase sigma factor (sigma-70 family)